MLSIALTHHSVALTSVVNTQLLGPQGPDVTISFSLGLEMSPSLSLCNRQTRRRGETLNSKEDRRHLEVLSQRALQFLFHRTGIYCPSAP